MRENHDEAHGAAVALLGLLAHSGRVAESRLDGSLEGAKLSLAKWYVLGHLVTAGGSLTLGAIAERQACVKSNVTQLVDRLEADGLVNRTGDPNDRRSRLAVMTDAGRSAFTKGTQIRMQVESELFGVLTPQESETLHQLLAKLQG